MNRLEKEAYYALRVYEDNGNILDKIDGPGDSGDWRYGMDMCPMELAIFAIDSKMLDKADKNLPFYNAERIALDKDYKETERKEKAICVECSNLEEARSIARKYKLDFFYWLFWEGPRQISIEPMNEEDEVVYYTYDD